MPWSRGAFDLVYTGIGALCWLPDIRRWAAVVAALLRPGGRLFIREGHPMLWAIDDTRAGDDLLVVRYPYFETAEPVTFTNGGTYVETDAVFEQTMSHSWNHGLGEIVTALIDAGLAVTGLVEHDSVPWEALPGKMERVDGKEWRLADNPARLPHSYTLQALKVGTSATLNPDAGKPGRPLRSRRAQWSGGFAGLARHGPSCSGLYPWGLLRCLQRRRDGRDRPRRRPVARGGHLRHPRPGRLRRLGQAGRAVGRQPRQREGLRRALRLGAGSLVDLYVTLSGDTGINLLHEDYAITAGNPPQSVALLHGGQDASQVTSHLTKLGWKQASGTLTGPSSPAGGGEAAAEYMLQLHKVRPDGTDVAFGGSRADLGNIGSPSGSTLAGDPVVGALANCLGDVVAAQFSVGGDLGGRNPVALALGIRTPASNTATPQAVVCVAWPSQAAAAQYAADARKALSSGQSATMKQPYSALLTHTSVTSVGGGQNLIQWQADTPGRASLIFEMLFSRDLPGLPDCTRLPAAARSHVIGCP